MKSSRFEWKVGLFVFVGLVLLGTLMIQFSKGGSFFASTYELRLVTSNVGAIKPRAAVLMAGVQVGWVVNADLNPNGRKVTIRIKVYRRYPIRSDASFFIDQSGFLGDQFVSITPFDESVRGPTGQTNAPAGAGTGRRHELAPYLAPGAVVECKEPFNLQEAARTAVGLMTRLDTAAQTLNEAVQRVDRIALAEQNLANLTNAVMNFRQLSQRLIGLADSADGILETNRAPIQHALTNLASFSDQLEGLTAEVRGLLASNRTEISAAVKNLESASGHAKELLAELQQGKGLAGSWLKNEQLSAQFGQVVSNLTLLSSNLNRYGLLYRPRPEKNKAVPASRLRLGKNPLAE